MHVLIKGRRQGKTTMFMDWVKGGERVDAYPYWSRVGIVVDERSYLDLKRQYWPEIEDFDHRIYQISEFERGRFRSHDTKYRVDNLDLLLWDFFHIPYLDGFTMTAEPWSE